MTVVPSHDIAGLVFSIISLAAVVPVCFMFRHYFRSLDFMQFVYMWAVLLGGSSNIFGNNLNNTWVPWNYNFLTFCTTGDLVCTTGFQLSFTICLIAVLLLLLLVVSLEKCTRGELRYEPIYTFFKGLFRWTYVPLTYYSIYFLISAINSGSSLVAPIVIAAVLAAFPFLQLIAYKCIQKDDDNIWRKWLQFFSYARLFIVAGIMVLGQSVNVLAYNFVFIPLGLYSLIYLWKGEFQFIVGQRIIFGLGEGVIITLFGLYLYHSSYIQTYDLDFFGIGGVLLMDLIFYIVKAIRLAKYGLEHTPESPQKINPEQNDDASVQRDKKEIPKKTNKYEYDSGEDLAVSRQSLNQLNTGKNIKKRR